MRSRSVVVVFVLALDLARSLQNVVTIGQGDVKGIELEARNGDKYTGFLGVPFATPPVGELRWKPPVPPKPWQGVWNASQHPPNCLQNEYADPKVSYGSEDCLYLNIFTKQAGNPHSKTHVMVWIHGGAFIFGGADLYGAKYFMEEDVVLVVIQYRLNIFGFLSAEDADLSGNYGSLDQVQALKWVQENIAAFGGDPESVTAFGMSAGGASVHYLMLSPLTTGLFKNAISMSGSALNWWAGVTETKTYAKRLAEHFSCPKTESGSDIATCLRNIPADDIIEAHSIFFQWKPTYFGREPMNVFSPRPDPEAKVPFMPKNPLHMMQNGRIQKVPYMLGHIENEGIWRANFIVPDGTENDNGAMWRDFWSNYDVTGPLAFGLFNNTKDVTNVLDKIKEYYDLNDMETKIPIPEEKIQNYIDAQSDTMFTYGIDTTAKLHAKNAAKDTFLYYFKYPTEHSLASFRIDGTTQRHPVELMRQAAHGSEILLMYEIFPHLGDLPPNDIQASRKWIQTIVDFGKNGSPTSYPDWRPLEEEKTNYLQVDETQHVKEGLPVQERMKFWENIDVYWKFTDPKVDANQKEEL